MPETIARRIVGIWNGSPLALGSPNVQVLRLPSLSHSRSTSPPASSSQFTRRVPKISGIVAMRVSIFFDEKNSGRLAHLGLVTVNPSARNLASNGSK